MRAWCLRRRVYQSPQAEERKGVVKVRLALMGLLVVLALSLAACNPTCAWVYENGTWYYLCAVP